MPEPTNMKLYNKVKAEIKKKVPKHSAYRSGMIVQEYKRRGGKYRGIKSKKNGLGRWFKESWSTQNGNKIYKKKGDIFRPTKRITKKTPITMGELSSNKIKRAMKEKKQTGHVKRF